jgi:Iron-containing redox enzyme
MYIKMSTDRTVDLEPFFPVPVSLGVCDTISNRVAYILSKKYNLLSESSEILDTINRDLPIIIHSAFNDRDCEKLLDIHKTLFEIYETSLGNPQSAMCSHNNKSWLSLIREQIETAWLNYELTIICDRLPTNTHTENPILLSEWFRQQSKAESDLDRTLMNFLENHASEDQFNKFILSDALLNYRFCDALSYAQIYFSDVVRAEIVSNMSDECGSGLADEFHSRQLTEMLASLNLKKPTTADWGDDWRPYAGHNLYFFLGLNRDHYFKSIGSLAMPELFDPNRNRSVVAGLNRLYGERKDYKFYSNHIETDEDHGSRWIDNAIAPIVKLQPEAGMELAIGGALRMESMHRYNEYLFERLGVSQLDL